MSNYKVISEELMVQKMAKGLVSKKSFKTVADEVVGKWCIMIQADSGVLAVGIDADKGKALHKAKLEAQALTRAHCEEYI